MTSDPSWDAGAGAVAGEDAGDESALPAAEDTITGEVFEPVAADEDVTAGEVDTLVTERDEYRRALQQLQADFENYKKRVAKQAEELRERAAEALVDKLLPVLDTADLAVAHGGGEEVKQVAASLASVLEKEGLERIDDPGGRFDPTVHDAVAHEPGDGAGGAGGQEVAEVLRAGYRWRGRVLRPAMVKVRG